MRTFSKFNLLLGAAGHALLSAVLLGFALVVWWRSLPDEDHVGSAQGNAIALLRGLKKNLTERGAAETMQSVFPEGACFTWSLYGWGWANVAASTQAPELRAEAVAEVKRALAGQMSNESLAPFGDTQVRNGVFWLGQRNYLLARGFQTTVTAEALGPELLDEFHRNSAKLAEAFLASPTHHLDSYDGMCWPADNVTALASLVLHDRLFGTDHARAYHAWKTWTLAHLDPLTNMPMGHLVQRTGQQIEPARGCANSLMITMLYETDPKWADQLYTRYVQEFGLRRLGFRMFREWPRRSTVQRTDIDSGPIVWGAGVTATGVGLGTARAAGDIDAFRDVADLSRMLGWPNDWKSDGDVLAAWHLGGWLPVGDAFLAWGWSVAPGHGQSQIGPWPTGGRISFHVMMSLIVAFLGGQYALGLIVTRKRWRRLTQLA